MIKRRTWRKLTAAWLVAMMLASSPTIFAATNKVQHKKTLHQKNKKIAHKKLIKKKKIHHVAAKTKRKIVRSHRAVVKSIPNIQPGPAVNLMSSQHKGLVASLEHRLVEFVHKTVTTLRYSAYKLGGTRFDPSKGVYIVDCSNYVDHILKVINPSAYSRLVAASRSLKPTSEDYYHFFTRLAHRPNFYWNAVNDVKALLPGDILVFRKKNRWGDDLGGHVMIVMEKPVRDKDVFWLRIADSAPFRHSLDTRLPRVSGIGIGTFLVKVNPKTFQPAAYAWTATSRWKKNVEFAMARPLPERS